MELGEAKSDISIFAQSVIHPFLASSPSLHQKPSPSRQTDPPPIPPPLTPAQPLPPPSPPLPPSTLIWCGPSHLRGQRSQRPPSSPRPPPPFPPSPTTTREQTTATPSTPSPSCHSPLPPPPLPPPLAAALPPPPLQSPTRAQAAGTQAEMTRLRRRRIQKRKQVAASQRRPVGQRSLSVNHCSFTSLTHNALRGVWEGLIFQESLVSS